MTNAWLIVLLVALGAVPAVARQQIDASPAPSVKAAFLFNFARFTEWPGLEPDARLMLCVVGDEGVASALTDTVRGQRIGQRALLVQAMDSDGPLRTCHILFVSRSETRRAKGVLGSLETLPVLTVSDDRDFAQSDGIIEFVVERERMRFVVNAGAGNRAGLRLSSRLLKLARIVGEDHGS